MEYIKCNICSLDCPEQLFKLKNADIVKCGNCGLVYTNPRPTKKELAQLYKSNYYHNKKLFEGRYCGYYDYEKGIEGTIKTFKIIQKNIKKYKKSGKLLDVGCGPGVYLDVAAKDGFDVKGLEISREGFEEAKRKFRIINKPLEEAKISEKFDVVTMFDVIEHLSDPNDALLRINKLLNKDGLLCISTPDIDSFSARIFGSKWPEINRLEHIYFFSKNTLKHLLNETGFKLIETHTIGKYFTLENFINETQIFNKTISKVLLKLISFLRMDKLQVYVNPFYKRVFYVRKSIKKPALN